VDKKWPWSEQHTWQSWRQRYKNNQDSFNHRARLYQKENLPEEHHTVLRSSKPKKEPTTAAEEEADDNEEVLQRKRKRVSYAGNGSAKRRKHDQAPSVTRPAQQRANAQAGAVVGPSKRRQSAFSSGQRASSKTGTINQKVKQPPKSGHPPAENTDTEEEEDEAVHSGGYSSESFIDQEPGDDESEFNAMSTDGMDEEIHDL